jgi:hypothetical protein
MQRTTNGAAGNGLYTTIKYMRGASASAWAPRLFTCDAQRAAPRETAWAATIKYLRHTTSAAANNGLSTTITPPCSAASFEEELRAPHRGTPLGPFVCGARACSLCSFQLWPYWTIETLNTATTKKLVFKNSHLTFVGAKVTATSRW